MAFCGSCGNRLSDAALACPKCGRATPLGETRRTSGPVPALAPNASELRPLGIGEIIDYAIKLYRANFLTLLKLVAIVVVPVRVLSAFIVVSATPRTTGVFPTRITPGQAPVFNASDFWAVGASLLVTTVLGVLASQLATAASLKAVSEAYLGERPDYRTSLRFALERLGPLVWLAILSTIFIGLGFIACIVPGLWLAVSWSVAVPVLLIEGRRGWEALSRSFSLVRGRWWHVFAVIIVSQLVAAVLSFIIGAPLAATLFLGGHNEFVDFLRNALSTSISQTLVTPFAAATIAIMYFDLRVRKEGFDLELLARNVGITPGTGDEPTEG